MVKRPVVVGLVICKDVIVDKTTRHTTLVNCVREVSVREFPTDPHDYTVCCVLADGLGEMNVTLEVNEPLADDILFLRTWRINLTDPVQAQWLLIIAEKLIFPTAARYEFALRIDGDWFAHNTVTLMAKGESS